MDNLRSISNSHVTGKELFKPQKFTQNIIILALLSVFFGCSVYQDVTSYFNTYYNAKKLYDDAVLELTRSTRPDKDTIYFSIPSKTTGQSKFDKVIEKCSKLIQNYPNSNLVDDAVLLIGKSGVYLGETELSIRKFNELFQNFPESELRFEAKLWYAKAFYFSNKQEEALRIIDELYPLALEAGEDEVAMEAEMLAAQIFFRNQDYDATIPYLERAVQLSGKDEMMVVAQFQLALCLDKTNEYERAAAAYKNVLNYNRDLTFDFKCRLRRGVMLYLAEHPDAALAVFQGLNGDNLKPDEQALVDHEVANVYASLGDSAKAFDLYQYVDTTYKRSDASARSFYRQGLIMEEQYGEYKKAKEYYDKSKGEFPTSEVVPLAQKRSDYIAKYFGIRGQIRSLDSLYVSILNQDSISRNERLKKILQAQADSAMFDSLFCVSDSISMLPDSLLRKALAVIDSSAEAYLAKKNAVASPKPKGGALAAIPKVKTDSTGAVGVDSLKNSLLPPSDSTQTLAALEKEALKAETEEKKEGEETIPKGEQAVEQKIPQVESQVPDEPVAEQLQQENAPPRRQLSIAELRAGERDDDDGTYEDKTAGITAGVPGTREGAGGGQRGAQNRGNQKGNTPASQVYSPAVNSGMSIDSIYYYRSKGYYELGTLFLLDMHLDDSAEFTFNRVVEEFPGSDYVPRSLYMLAELYRTLDDSCGMDSLYRIIHHYHHNTVYAKNLRKYFGEPLDTAKAIDSLAAEYASINVMPDSAHALQSIALLDSFSARNTGKPIAAKAMYAMGWIYENVLINNDSAASVYKKLATEYPSSEYTTASRPKVAVKEKPETLSQYVHVAEIQAIAKPAKKEKAKKGDNKNEEPNQDDQPASSIRDRLKDRDAEENGDENADQENIDENNEEPTEDENQGDTEENTDDTGGDDSLSNHSTNMLKIDDVRIFNYNIMIQSMISFSDNSPYLIDHLLNDGSKNPLRSVLRPRRTTKSNRIEHSARTQSGAGIVFGTTLKKNYGLHRSDLSNEYAMTHLRQPTNVVLNVYAPSYRIQMAIQEISDSKDCV